MNLPKPIRDALFLILVLLALLFLFSMQGILQQVEHYSGGEKITGEDVRIGSKTPPKITPPKITPPKKGEPTNKNLRCWTKAGIQQQDLKIVRTLLQTTTCTETKDKKEVKASIQDQCLKFDIEQQITTNICVDKKTPHLELTIPTQGQGTVEVPTAKRNYLPAILFILILFIVFGIWSWDEMRSTFNKTLDLKKYDELELFYGANRIPDYTLTKEKETPPNKINEIYENLLKEKQKRNNKNILNKKEAKKTITLFNKQTDQLYKILKRNDIATAKKSYDQLFKTFLKIYNSVQENNKKTLLKIMLYFDKQIKLLKKSTKISHLIKEAYKDVNKHKVTKQHL